MAVVAAVVDREDAKRAARPGEERVAFVPVGVAVTNCGGSAGETVIAARLASATAVQRMVKYLAGDAVADLEELRAAIEAVEEQLTDARAQLQESETTIERLHAARVEAEGRFAITRRAVLDFEQRLEEQQKALVKATREAAIAGYERAVGERDAAIEQVIAAARTLIAAFEAAEAARKSVAGAAQEARRVRAVVPNVPPPESSIPEEEWARLHELVGAHSQARLDEELIAAAVRSNNPLVVKELPPYLREAARARVRAAGDEARRRPKT